MMSPTPSASIHIEDNSRHVPTRRSTLSPRCTRCHAPQKSTDDDQQEHPRNLIVCIDGTSNQHGEDNTNVVKLFTKIDLKSTNPKQYAYYSSGIGTRPESLYILNRVEKSISDKLDMAVAWNIDRIVKDAYGWLARMYREGDLIYLFGFSRGAYQVRVLAGMIYEVGLIKTPTTEHIDTAYDYYEVICSGKSRTRQVVREFKEKFSWEGVKVHFIGVWDTVSSVGIIRKDVFLSASSSAVHACHFRHALALDECRVKFMPEYVLEMNSQTDERDDGISKYIVPSANVGCAGSSASERRESTDGTDLSGGKNISDIKEVWFAGSHSDVGGANRPGKSHQAGNASLLWMRREAAANGLSLQSTGIVWVPDDLDFGTRDSMTPVWRVIEYAPIKHQISFSGAGEYARRLHRLQPRRIIPGQKIHASVLYANAYRPKATLGEGFDIPMIQSGLEDTKLDDEIWETGLFDDTSAEELVTYLDSQQGVAPIYFDRLLFMLRSEEGKQCIKNAGLQDKFKKLVEDRHRVQLIMIVAYCEISCNHEMDPENCTRSPMELSQDMLDDAGKYLHDVLAAHKHRDGPRVLALLRPLTKHPTLRKHILTQDILETCVKLLDVIALQPKGYFIQAMDGLNCLLQCEDTRVTLVQKLMADPGDETRLCQILVVNDSHLLTAALRMILTLARIPEARDMCSVLKPRLRQLAGKDKRLVGPLAVEILLALYDPNDRNQLNIRDAHGRVLANLADASVRLKLDRHDVGDHFVGPGEQILRNLLGLDVLVLNEQQRKLIRELRMVIQKGNTRERTAATMTLLKLCKVMIIRAFLREINLLDVFVGQLRHKDSALLAAYALATCLEYSDMRVSITINEDFPKHIVGMLRLDYFDDAIGQVEGFQIFGVIMQYDELREKIMNCDITKVLDVKLRKGKPREIRTSLICLDIFRSFDPDGPWTRDLVKKSLECLNDPVWKIQKAGVAILSGLARTKYGVEAISPRIEDIVGILLPVGDPLRPNLSQPSVVGTTSAEVQAPPATLTMNTQSATPDVKPRSHLGALGPACALRILAQNETLRNLARKTRQYARLKDLHISGMLVDETDTAPWCIWTPNRTDVVDMLNEMIKAVDHELPDEGLMSIGKAVLPHIQHWDHLVTMLSKNTVGRVTVLSALLGVSVLAILTVAVSTPIYLSVRSFEWLRSRYRNSRIFDNIATQDRQPRRQRSGSSSWVGERLPHGTQRWNDALYALHTY